MKRALQLAALACASVLVTLLLFEGGYAIARGGRADTSLVFRLFERTQRAIASRPVGFYLPVLVDAEPLEALIPAFGSDGVGLGNSAYRELRTERARINTKVNGCKRQKPGIDKEMTFLRTALHDPFKPVTAQYDSGTSFSPDVAAFLERYGTRRIRHRTNAQGERWTLPAVEAKDKVLIAGDSVANGAFVNDDETLASRLQARDPERQYVNLGVAGADADEVLCNLESALERYRGQVRELIYVYCENDFQPRKPLGSPEPVVERIAALVGREGIAKATIVFAPAVYNVLPHKTRFRGYRGERYPNHRAQRERLERAAQAAGIGLVDFGSLALREIEASGTEYAGLSLFLDVAHWSPLGTTRIAEALRAR